MATRTGKTVRDFRYASTPAAIAREIFFVGGVHFRAGAMKIDRAVVAFLVGACYRVRDPFCKRRAYGPPERIDGANGEHGRRAVPAGIAQGFAAVFGAERFERPRGVRAEFGGDAEFAEHFLRFADCA